MLLSEANTGRIRSTVHLPFKLEEQIVLDVDRLHALLQLGGTRSLRITSNQDGETSQTSFSVIGVNSGGSAMAGKTEMKIIPTFTNSVDKAPDKRLTKQASWQDMKVSFNVAELKKRILTSNEDVREPALWAKEIDLGLRVSITQAGEQHLLTFGRDPSDKLRNSGWFVFGALSAATGGVNSLIRYAAITMPLHLALDSFLNGVEKPGSGQRLGLFRGWEFDRAVVLGMYALAGPVARENFKKIK